MIKRIKTFIIRQWFKYRLKKGDLIKVDERHRGIGKTTMMVVWARDNDYGIIVGNQIQAYIVKKMCRGIRVYRYAENFTFELRGVKDSVLIDESVKPSLIESIEKVEPRIKIRGGFIQNYGSDKNES